MPQRPDMPASSGGQRNASANACDGSRDPRGNATFRPAQTRQLSGSVCGRTRMYATIRQGSLGRVSVTVKTAVKSIQKVLATSACRSPRSRTQRSQRTSVADVQGRGQVSGQARRNGLFPDATASIRLDPVGPCRGSNGDRSAGWTHIRQHALITGLRAAVSLGLFAGPVRRAGSERDGAVLKSWPSYRSLLSPHVRDGFSVLAGRGCCRGSQCGSGIGRIRWDHRWHPGLA